MDFTRDSQVQTVQLLTARFGSLEAAFHIFKNREGQVTKMNLLKGVRTHLGLAPSCGYALLELFDMDKAVGLTEWTSALSSLQSAYPVEEAEIQEKQASPAPVDSCPPELSDIELQTDIDLDSDVDSLCSLPLREDEALVSFPRPPKQQGLSLLQTLARTTSQLRRSRQDLRKRLLSVRWSQLRLY